MTAIMEEIELEIVAFRSPLHGGSDGAMQTVLLLPWGEVDSANGRFTIDREAAESIIAAFRESRVDLVVDVGHQTLGGRYASPDGFAPAVGWIKNMRVEAGVGIHALVEWNKRGAELVGSKAYRYLSPVLYRSGSRAACIHSVGLVNDPAIRGMPALVNSRSAGAEDRTAAIAAAGVEWDAHKVVHKICSRHAYIDQALREGGHAELTDPERTEAVVAAMKAEGLEAEAALTEHRAATAWDSDPFLQKRLKRESFVADCLRIAGMNR